MLPKGLCGRLEETRHAPSTFLPKKRPGEYPAEKNTRRDVLTEGHLALSYPGFSKNFALHGIHLLDFSGKKMKGSSLFGHEFKAGPDLATLPDPICRFLAPHIL